LKGQEPYGLYPLVGNLTSIVVVDFDYEDLNRVDSYVKRASHFELPAYVERSKSKGFHVWTFLETAVLAWKVRRIAQRILEEIDYPDTEIFPKQDSIRSDSKRFGNFINLPLFGLAVRQERCIFLDRDHAYTPFDNQWDFLENMQVVSSAHIDDLVELNDLEEYSRESRNPSWSCSVTTLGGLPPCARRMLEEGVTDKQRVACFRLAVQLRRIGLPFDLVVALLIEWRKYNRPSRGKNQLSELEVNTQTASAYLNDYKSFGCEDEAVNPYCDSSCPIYSRSRHSNSKNRSN
jgi:hypothetical protein